MTLIQGRGCPRRKRLSVPLFDSFPPPESNNDLFDQPAGLLKANFPIVIVPAAALAFPKYTEKDLQWILKTVLEAWDKPLKACSPDVYHGKFHMEYDNVYQ